jgi:hypothetical protein
MAAQHLVMILDSSPSASPDELGEQRWVGLRREEDNNPSAPGHALDDTRDGWVALEVES